MKTEYFQYEKITYQKEVQKGYANTESTIDTIDPELTKSWTSKLDPSLLLSMVSIPGTHNSGSAHAPCWSQFSARNQSLTIKAQLEAGIRFLQIRVKYSRYGKWDKPSMVLFHGPIQMNLTFIEAVQQVKSFMQENSQENIILYFQGMEQRDSKGVIQDPSRDILEVLRSELGDDKIMLSKYIPTVGESRGKVWVMGGCWILFEDETFIIGYNPRVGNCDHPHGQYNKYYMEGLYQICKELTVEEKANRVANTAFNIKTQPNRLKINGLGASGSTCIDFFVNRPIAVAQNPLGPNARLCAGLKDPGKERAMVGLCIGDFLGPLLIYRIIRSNGVS